LRPDRPFLVAAVEAVRQGWRAAYGNLRSIIALQVAMGAIVAIYYLWPPGSAVLSRYALWQASGGALGTGFVYAIAGGVLSELSFVYFQQRGRWTRANVENIGFKFVIFFVGGSVVYEFYRLQAVWWGTGASLRVLVPKVLVDQFGYTVIFAAPYYALLTRWQALRYSGAKLWREIRSTFLTDRLLPMLVMNWMFWIPAISFVYAMPTVLQPPLAAFATAIWGLLVSAIGSLEPAHPRTPTPVAAGPAGTPPMVAAPVK
jgi:hypothetical protein